MPGVERFAEMMVSGWNWLLVLGAFMVVGMFAERMAQSATSMSTQYLGLAMYVLVEAVIFIPLIYIARLYEAELGVSIVMPAGLGTIAVFTTLSAIVFLTGKDFSFMRGALMMCGFAAIGLIVCSIVFNFDLGIIFTLAMIVFASLYVLYYTSNVLHHYRTDQPVAASLALFAALALLFWYILRLALYIAARSE